MAILFLIIIFIGVIGAIYIPVMIIGSFVGIFAFLCDLLKKVMIK